MPFISEELYQRLPRRDLEVDPESIMVTSYPEIDDFAKFRDRDLEVKVEYAQKVVAAVRSARSDYNLPNKAKTRLFLKAFDKNIAESLKVKRFFFHLQGGYELVALSKLLLLDNQKF